MPGYSRDREGGLPSFEELLSTGPSLSTQDLAASVLEQMGEPVPAGYLEHQRLQYRGRSTGRHSTEGGSGPMTGKKAEDKAARKAADEHTRLSEELQPAPEPPQVGVVEEPVSPYYRSRSLHPDDARELVTVGGHAAGGHAGFGAAVSN